MKINWGTGIAIFYTCFVVAMVYMVIKSTQNKTDLVQENYYDKDLNYEAFRSKRQNATELLTPAVVKYMSNKNHVNVTLPVNMRAAEGKVTFFRPSDKEMDKSYQLDLDQNASMNIPVTKTMARGLWKVQIDWESGGQKYFSEESIIL